MEHPSGWWKGWVKYGDSGASLQNDGGLCVASFGDLGVTRVAGFWMWAGPLDCRRGLFVTGMQCRCHHLLTGSE